MKFEEDNDFSEKYYEKYTKRFENKIKKQERKLKDSTVNKKNKLKNDAFGGRTNKRKLTPKDEKFETVLKKALKNNF